MQRPPTSEQIPSHSELVTSESAAPIDTPVQEKEVKTIEEVRSKLGDCVDSSGVCANAEADGVYVGSGVNAASTVSTTMPEGLMFGDVTPSIGKNDSVQLLMGKSVSLLLFISKSSPRALL